MVLLVVLLLMLCVVVLTLSRFWRHRLTDHRRMDADRVASVDPWAEAGRRCDPDAGDASDDDDDDDDDQTDDEYGGRFDEEQW